MHPFPTAALAATALALLAPATATATTTVSLSTDGRTVNLAGDGAPSTLDVFRDGTAIEVVSYYDPFAGSSADYLEAGPGCTENSPAGGSRVWVRCEGVSATDPRLTGLLGGGDDYVLVHATFPGGVVLDGGDDHDTIDGYAGAGSTSQPIALSGGDGSDSLAGDAGADTLDGGEGGDVLSGRGGADALTGGAGADALSGEGGVDSLLGGAGADDLSGGDENDDLRGEGDADDLTGGDGNDRLDGGAGDDAFEGAASASADTDGADVVIGGSGQDAMGYQSRADYDHTAVTLDDAADDGRAGGADGATLEADDVRSDVEHVASARSGATARIAGTGARNELTGLADRNTVRGGAGDDLIVTACYPSCVDGGDTVDGGEGNDEIRTGDGADAIVGGPGEDEIHADNCSSYTCAEPDRIDVVDGERDHVYCGGGGDVVRADPVDQLVMCANVTIVTGEAPGGTPPATTGTTTTTTTTPTTAPAPAVAPTTAAAPRCRVPRLRGLTPATARRRLKAAGCALGRIRRPLGSGGRLVVRRQTRRAGRSVPRGTKVGVTLVRRRGRPS